VDLSVVREMFEIVGAVASFMPAVDLSPAWTFFRPQTPFDLIANLSKFGESLPRVVVIEAKAATPSMSALQMFAIYLDALVKFGVTAAKFGQLPAVLLIQLLRSAAACFEIKAVTSAPRPADSYHLLPSVLSRERVAA
jgi:hypothetical protein